MKIRNMRAHIVMISTLLLALRVQGEVLGMAFS
jgi:hypothetical protein